MTIEINDKFFNTKLPSKFITEFFSAYFLPEDVLGLVGWERSERLRSFDTGVFWNHRVLHTRNFFLAFPISPLRVVEGGI